jgi:hypothetical protein
MPTAEQLPPELADLAYRNAVELTHARWESDVQVLIDALERWVAPPSAASTPAPPQSPPAHETPSAAAATPRRGLGLSLLAVASVLVVAVAGWLLTRPGPDDPRGHEGERREIALLITQATGDDLSARRSATARLIERHAKSALAVQLVLEQLSEANFQRLSKEGRVNVLTFLLESNPATWSEGMRVQARLAVRRIRDRLAAGTATLGPQVMELLVKLGDKLGA